MRLRTPSPRDPLVVLLGALALAGCAFSEGPHWPPLKDPATGAPRAAEAGAMDGEDQRASLAGLVSGEAAPPPPGGGAALVGQARPLAVIRFGAAPVDYEGALYIAVRSVLERRPHTAFDVVAVAPGLSAPDQAGLRSQSAAVFRSLTLMGLPVERLSLSAMATAGVAANEVHVYLR